MSHGTKVWIALGTVYLIWGSTYLGTSAAALAGVIVGFGGLVLLVRPSGGAPTTGPVDRQMIRQRD